MTDEPIIRLDDDLPPGFDPDDLDADMFDDMPEWDPARAEGLVSDDDA